MEQKIFVGAHASIAKGYPESLKSIHAMGGNSVQIFLKSPRGGSMKPLTNNDQKESIEFLKNNNMFLIGHCSYLLNFAKDPEEYPWAVESLIEDMIRIDKLGGVGVVLHIGKYLDMPKNQAYNNIKKSVEIVIDRTPQSVKVIFENTAGQGTEIGYKFEELKEIYNQFSNEYKKRIGFCLDTCHSHAAGYDLSTKEGVKDWLEQFDKNVGLNKLVCIHFNDSKFNAGEKKDRHEDLTYGTIGIEGLKEISIFAKEKQIPLILETTTVNLPYKKQIEMIKKGFN
jgi:deoxyribonuclease-4